ncbi:MAG: HAMP domain-containing protein [Eubacterium sp.]|nr:HAMP domain-containing protein [Eubacterium sp.]
MKSYSLKTKITLWVSVLVIIISFLSALSVLYFSNNITQGVIKRNLISAVESNINEIEIFDNKKTLHLDDEFDIFVKSNNKYIVIDDDFIKEVNNVNISLYDDNDVVYGENLVSAQEHPYSDSGIKEFVVDDKQYFVYDKPINTEGAENLWLRGTIQKDIGFSQTISALQSFVLFVPLIVLIAVLGAILLSSRSLNPIEKISESAQEIRHGNDLSKRIEQSGNTREITILTDSFNGMLERLETSFERERRFNSDVSHELRTPLSVILTAGELASQEDDLQQYKESMEIILRQGNKMSKMINSMLEYSRLDTQNLCFEGIDFSSLVSALAKDIELTDTKSIKLLCDIQDDVFVFADRELISRLVSNLITNAFKYTKQNGSISVSLKNNNGICELSVKDDGIGISKKDIEKIFNMFYRSDTSRNEPGFGLGLSFVKKIAAIHGGTIEVISTEGVGSEFIYKQKIFKNKLF